MSKLPIIRTYPSSWAKSSQSFFKFFAVPLGIFLCECLLWTRRLLWIILSGGEVSSISLSTSPFLISKHIQYNMVHIIWTNMDQYRKIWNQAYSIWKFFDKLIFKFIFWIGFVWFNINRLTFNWFRTHFRLQRSWRSWLPVALFRTRIRSCFRRPFGLIS